jgi:hypothetical protein
MKYSVLHWCVILVCCSLCISADFVSSGAAPAGYTGAEQGRTCINCHGGRALNEAGGSVVINNLPQTYQPGETYNFSVSINHRNADRTRWGFAIKAVANGKTIGTFSEDNINAFVNGSAGEIGHLNAPVTNQSASYTFSGLKWTAPLTPSLSEKDITFYVAANAVGNNDDYIYSSSKSISLNTTSTDENKLPIDNYRVLALQKNLQIRFNLKKPDDIQVAIYNMNGQKILENSIKKFVAGAHELNIDGSMLSPGTYIVTLHNGVQKITKKVVL